MKYKKIALSLILCLTFLFSGFVFVGCKDVTIAQLEENFSKLDSAIESAEVFESGQCEGLATTLLVKGYGNFVDDKIKTDADYAQLSTLYNSMLVISNDYVQQNRIFVLGLDESKLSKEAKACMKDINNGLVSYQNAIPEFVKARESLMEHFSKFGGEDALTDSAVLLKFKKVYGKLVTQSVNLSTKMAEMVEYSKIFNILKDTTPVPENTNDLKEYIRAKMLPIFSEFKITELANKMSWSAQKDGSAKERVDKLIANIDKCFAAYKNLFLKSEVKKEALSTEDFNQVLNWADEFFVEMDAYFQALKGLDLYKLAVNFDNNFENYLKSNSFAEIYLGKLEQFSELTILNFMDAVSGKLL